MAELWKQCASWLCRLEVLPANHRIIWPDATIQHLAYTLRDGVLLCHIAAMIDDSVIDMRTVNQRPQMAQFLCLKNIRIFLNACTGAFGLKETDLFKPSMLYDYTDFARVLHTLSKLSNCAKATAKGVTGFPQHPKAPTQDEEQIYRALEDLVDDEHYEDFYYRHHGGGRGVGGLLHGGGAGGSQGVSGGSGGSRGKAGGSSQYYTALEQEEDIYEDLCSFKNQSSRRMQRELSFQPKEKRDHCIKELVESEGKYVDVLNMLRKHFIRTINSMKDLDKKTVFMNIKDLGETHAAFYQDILESVTGKSRKRIGEIFLEFKERFLKYGDYCSDLPKALQTLDMLQKKDERIREEIAKCELSANEGKFKLRDLLPVPMQRVLKYHLLLRELMSHTASTHEEAKTIQSAYEAMLDVSDYINEVKRDSEQLHIIREIQSSITDWNMPAGVELKDYGRLRKDSELKVQSHDTNVKTKVRYVFVFDKVMLMCKPTRGDHYSYKNSLKLSEYKVQDDQSGTRTSVDNGTMGRLGRDSRWAYSFLLVHTQNLNVYKMFARTEEDKNKWMSAIHDALSNIFPTQRNLSAHEANMCTFEKPVNCDYCHKLLKGLFYQGYKCSKCHSIMHKGCISLLSKCGLSQPPALPPRPPSMQLPVATNLMDNRFSNCSIDEGLSTLLHRQSSLMSIASLPPPTTPAPILNLNALSTPATHNPDYINTNMEEHSWYVGEIDRDAAIQQLDEYPVSTFLVRCRVQHGERVGYALSLKTTPEDVKHMKICTQNTAEGNWFYLSDTRKFRSIVELVSYFSRNSLKESFSGLDITLRFSVGELSIVEALFDFNDKEKNMLPMRVGERVTIIDKSGDSQGWWKACSNMKVGFIPKDYVQTIQPESVAMAITPTLETCSSLDTASTRDTGSTSAPSVADQSASQLDTSAVELATAAAAS